MKIIQQPYSYSPLRLRAASQPQQGALSLSLLWMCLSVTLTILMPVPVKSASYQYLTSNPTIINDIQGSCLTPIITSANGDNYISKNEFPTFIKTLSLANDLYDERLDVTTFALLPLPFMLRYNLLLCHGVSNGPCPTVGINVTGADDITNVDKDTRVFLERICINTLDDMYEYLDIDKPWPTGAPTTSPTMSPSDSPSTSPTMSPTNNPTTSPTMSPSDSPTTSPINSPTTSPTISPSDSPTTSPTKAPTSSPITPTPTIPNTVEPSVTTIPLTVAQTFGFDENDVKNNVDGVKTIINNIWLDFSEDLESRLFLEQIGGGDGNRNRMLRSKSSNSGASTSDKNA